MNRDTSLTSNEKFTKAYMSYASQFGHKDGPRLRLLAYQADITRLRRVRPLKQEGRNDIMIRQIQEVVNELKRRLRLPVPPPPISVPHSFGSRVAKIRKNLRAKRTTVGVKFLSAFPIIAFFLC